MKLTPAQKQKIRELAQKYQLKLVLIFGSQITARLTRESDIDIAVLAEKTFDLQDEINLNYELTRIFQNEHLDLTDLKKAPPLLMKEIIDHCQILYQKESTTFDNFYVYALQRYQEAKPLYQIHQQAIQDFIQQTL